MIRRQYGSRAAALFEVEDMKAGTPGRHSEDLPSFSDPNLGPLNDPSPAQIERRAALVRETWDESRWGQQKRQHGMDDFYSVPTVKLGELER